MTIRDGLTKISRRSLTATGAGFAIGVLGRRAGAFAHEATPDAAGATPASGLTPLGYSSIRLRKLTAPEHRAEVNALVIEQFAPEVVAIEGFEGYLVGDVIDQPEWSLSVLVLDHAEDEAAFDALAQARQFQLCSGRSVPCCVRLREDGAATAERILTTSNSGDSRAR